MSDEYKVVIGGNSNTHPFAEFPDARPDALSLLRALWDADIGDKFKVCDNFDDNDPLTIDIERALASPASGGSDGLERGFDVTDPEDDAPDGARLMFERHGGRWESVPGDPVARAFTAGYDHRDALREAVPGLDELRALSEAATPGPWCVTGSGERQNTLRPNEAVERHSFTGVSFSHDEDAAFVAAAVNYVRSRLSPIPDTAQEPEGMTTLDEAWAAAEAAFPEGTILLSRWEPGVYRAVFSGPGGSPRHSVDDDAPSVALQALTKSLSDTAQEPTGCVCCEEGFYCRHRCPVHPKVNGLADSGKPWAIPDTAQEPKP